MSRKAAADRGPRRGHQGQPRRPSDSSQRSHRPASATSMRQVGSRTARCESKRFIEKPDLATARRFMQGGWLLLEPRVVRMAGRGLHRRAARVTRPGICAGLRKVIAARSAGDEARAAALYSRLPVEVIDRSVMEKTDRLLLVPADFDWADIGNWAELGDRVRADDQGQLRRGGDDPGRHDRQPDPRRSPAGGCDRPRGHDHRRHGRRACWWSPGRARRMFGRWSRRSGGRARPVTYSHPHLRLRGDPGNYSLERS